VVGGKNAILTKDNMRKRKWVGDTCCRFCEVEKNINHLFFDCVVARVIWGILAQCFGADNIHLT
jgi:hypothetical protein